MIATQKPKFVLMMVGVNDRRSIRETAAPVPVRPAKPAVTTPADPAALELDKGSDSAKPDQAPDPTPLAPGGSRTLEFRSDAWSEAYIKRIDETIAALKTSNVPVFWVGLPPIRGQKSVADISFLNDLYRSRADKAGIIYIDVWDGFVDEEGRFIVSGPDVEGQTRRLRAGDGAYFTQAGARKLAHYVEREIQRWLAARATPVALPGPEDVKVEAPAVAARGLAPVGPAGAGGAGSAHTRPLAGPTVPLVAERSSESEELLGGNAKHPATDAIVTKVLVKGEAVGVPAGRADDFAWPRRGVAPVGNDPVVATTELPMTPMLAEKPPAPAGTAGATAAAAGTDVAGAAPARPRRVAARPQNDFDQQSSFYRPDSRPSYPRQWAPFSFGGLFGGFGGRW
jgi:uncharacterized protein